MKKLLELLYSSTSISLVSFGRYRFAYSASAFQLFRDEFQIVHL